MPLPICLSGLTFRHLGFQGRHGSRLSFAQSGHTPEETRAASRWRARASTADKAGSRFLAVLRQALLLPSGRRGSPPDWPLSALRPHSRARRPGVRVPASAACLSGVEPTRRSTAWRGTRISHALVGPFPLKGSRKLHPHSRVSCHGPTQPAASLGPLWSWRLDYSTLLASRPATDRMERQPARSGLSGPAWPPSASSPLLITTHRTVYLIAAACHWRLPIVLPLRSSRQRVTMECQYY